MSSMDLEAPGVMTWDNTGGYDGNVLPEQTYDAMTVGIRDHLNAQYPYPPTIPPQFPAYVRAYDNGPGDDTYSVSGLGPWPMFSGRQGAMNYDPMVSNAVVRYEAPDIPVDQLPWRELINDSTLSWSQIGPEGPMRVSYRAPGNV